MTHCAHSSGSTGNLQSLNPYSSNREPCVDVAVHWCVVVLKVSIKTSTTLLVNCPTSVLSFGYLYWSSIFSQPRSQMKYSAAMYYHSLSLELHIPKYLGAPLDIKCFQKIIYRFTSFYFHTFYFLIQTKSQKTQQGHFALTLFLFSLDCCDWPIVGSHFVDISALGKW